MKGTAIMYTFKGKLAKIDCARLIKESAEQPGQIAWFSLDGESPIVLGKRELVERASKVGLELSEYATYNSISGYKLTLEGERLCALRVNDFGDYTYTLHFRSIELATKFATDLRAAERKVHTVTVGSLL